MFYARLSPVSFQNGVFGVPLGGSQRHSTVQYGSRSVPVPKFLAEATEFLEDYLTVEGLFRKAGSLTRQREIKVYCEPSYILILFITILIIGTDSNWGQLSRESQTT